MYRGEHPVGGAIRRTLRGRAVERGAIRLSSIRLSSIQRVAVR
jgi:hypothetical protein